MQTSRDSFHGEVETPAVPGRLTQCGRTRRVAPEPECAESSARRRHVLVQGAGWSMSVADAGLSTCCPPDPMSNARLRHSREGVLDANMCLAAAVDLVVVHRFTGTGPLPLDAVSANSIDPAAGPASPEVRY